LLLQLAFSAVPPDRLLQALSDLSAQVQYICEGFIDPFIHKQPGQPGFALSRIFPLLWTTHKHKHKHTCNYSRFHPVIFLHHCCL
jgi:hypothetical protein